MTHLHDDEKAEFFSAAQVWNGILYVYLEIHTQRITSLFPIQSEQLFGTYFAT